MIELALVPGAIQWIKISKRSRYLASFIFNEHFSKNFSRENTVKNI